jgi:glycosyltransferase involved in cell wall biosynthesis
MRVLALSNMYPPHHYGGYELSCWDIMRRFSERGHDTAVLTSDIRRDDVSEDPDERQLGVRRDLRIYWDDHVLLEPSLRARLAIERHNQERLAAALAETNPDVVSVWNMGAMSLGLLRTISVRQIPIVYVVADDWFSYGPKLDAWIAYWSRRSRRQLAPLVEAITGVPARLPDIGTLGAGCFCSDATRRFARDNTPWTFPTTGVVYLGIDPADFPVPEAGVPVVERPWRGRLLYVGRIDGRKGIDTAIGALARLEGTTLRVIGSGDSSVLADLRAMAAGLGVGDRVEFGTLPRAELRAAYLDADVCLFPSTWAEPFGLVPLEAMACDTPVVATGTGGSGEFLSDGRNCLLFTPGDAMDLAGAVKRLAEDAALRTELVDGGRTTARALTIDTLADVLEAWHVGAATGYPDGTPPDRHLPG